jgi:DNA polymerase III delta prime subunit
MVLLQTEYPSLGDDDFRDRLVKRPDYQLFKSIRPPMLSREEFDVLSKEQCEGFEKTIYQHLMQHYLSMRSPYRGLLMYHSLGSGKSCSSITVAEAFLKTHRQGDEPSIIVVSTGTLHKSYEGQIFSISQKASLEALREQCTGDYYMRLVGKPGMPATEKERDSLQREIDAKIKQRYEFITYHNFATKLVQLDKEGKLGTIRNKVIIIDEAHNLRDTSSDLQQQKALTQPLIKMLRMGRNNRLVLLSATPMYNEPDEILWLLSLLCVNDKRADLLDPDKLPPLFQDGVMVPATKRLLQRLSSEYVSYIRGNTPFTFPVRVSPASMGVPMLTASITDEVMPDPSWPTYYTDGLVPTQLGTLQLESLQDAARKAQDIRAVLKTHEQMNCIAYKGKTGRELMQDMFEVSTTPTLSFKYRTTTPWLSPVSDLLGSVACKMQRICEFIRTSTGIVVVYSNHNWSGIFPIAMALEHAGFSRHGGTRLLSKVPTSKKHPRVPPYIYPGISSPQYVILSGNQDVMKGGRSITELLRDVNSRDNMDGSIVKVVLITPIAREGLTIKNVREMHILNPWYNVNSLEQVIGRAIRTCSHMLKPLEERNVTVYLHTTVGNDPSMDTADLNSYRISARKLSQTNEVASMLRDNAWDCSLMKGINYMPPDMFGFAIHMRTSQGTVMQHRYGNVPADEPMCPEATGDKGMVRPDAYNDIIPTIQARLRKHVRARMLAEKKDTVMVPIKDLPTILRLKDFPEVVMSTVQASLEKDGLLSGHRVFIHRDSLYVVPIVPVGRGAQVSIPVEHEAERATEEERMNVFEYITNIQDDNEAIIFLYDTLYADTWPQLADMLIHAIPETMAPWMKRVGELLHREGALVSSREYPSLRTSSTYIGYYDFFKEGSPIYILGVSGRLGIANAEETAAIQKKRRQVFMPKAEEEPRDHIGIYVPYKSPKEKRMRLVFKVLRKGVPVRATNPGIACTSMSLDELNELWTSLGIPENLNPKSKKLICGGVSSILLEKGRMILPPLYKPMPKK